MPATKAAVSTAAKKSNRNTNRLFGGLGAVDLAVEAMEAGGTLAVSLAFDLAEARKANREWSELFERVYRDNSLLRSAVRQMLHELRDLPDANREESERKPPHRCPIHRCRWAGQWVLNEVGDNDEEEGEVIGLV